jgi:hypothetical protein
MCSRHNMSHEFSNFLNATGRCRRPGSHSPSQHQFIITLVKGLSKHQDNVFVHATWHKPLVWYLLGGDRGTYMYASSCKATHLCIVPVMSSRCLLLCCKAGTFHTWH